MTYPSHPRKTRNTPSCTSMYPGYQFMFRARMCRSLIPVSNSVKDQRTAHPCAKHKLITCILNLWSWSGRGYELLRVVIFLLIPLWESLKCEALTDVYSITYARVRIVYDKSYREDRPLSPFSTRRICSRDAKRKQEFGNVIGWRKSSLYRQPITLLNSCFRFASREQIRLVENGL